MIRIDTLGFDADDTVALAGFWSELLGWSMDEPDDDGEIVVSPPDGSPPGTLPLLFLPVPEGKQAKNRLHLDLRPDDQEAAVARAEALGARRIDIGQGDDVTWVVLADPEGNEFCILRALTAEELTE